VVYAIISDIHSNIEALGEVLKAEIPFGFKVRSTPFPAGGYTLQESGNVLMLRHIDGKGGGVITFVIPDERPQASATGELVFHSYGDSRFLAQINVPASKARLTLQMSREEKELARQSPTPGVLKTKVEVSK